MVMLFPIMLAGLLTATSTSDDSQPTAGDIGLPTDISTLEVARFRKPIAFANRNMIRAEKIARDAECKLPVDPQQWVHARVHAALLVSPQGQVERVIPVSMGCSALERFAADYIASKARNSGPIPQDGQERWYRTVVHFQWPE